MQAFQTFMKPIMAMAWCTGLFYYVTRRQSGATYHVGWQFDKVRTEIYSLYNWPGKSTESIPFRSMQ